MATVPTPTRKVNRAFYATLYNDELHGVLGQVAGTLYFFADDGQILDYSPDMAPWLTLLGEVSLSDTARLLDTLHGSAPRICTTRMQEVA